jgi:4-hydroxy-tetrahydrodipicolinate synthase
MAPFGDVLTAMITPFSDNGDVDHDRAYRLARHLVDQGSDGIVVTGTTGESPTLSAEEKVALYRTVVEAIGGRASVLAGTGTYDTRESVRLSERAAAIGVDGLMAVTPYYSKPEQAGILAHFHAIADATDLPVLVYNIPGRTGRRIEIDTLARMSEHARIVATKDAVMDIDFTSETVRRVPGLAVYSGQDSYTWPMMAVGAVGVVSVISHLAGREVAAMVAAAKASNMTEAARLHAALLPLCWACFRESNPAPVKGALNALWEPVGSLRLPLIDASDSTVQEIKDALGGLQAS